jgi:hypothetical protein
MRAFLSAFLIAGAVSPAVVCAAAPTMQPGLWEITTKTEMPGMPMAMPAQTMRHCYRPEDVKDPKSTVPADKNCKMESFNQSGNTVTWQVSCQTEGGPMSGKGTMTQGAQSYTGTTTMKGKMQGMDMTMNMSYSGKRVGECK